MNEKLEEKKRKKAEAAERLRKAAPKGHDALSRFRELNPIRLTFKHRLGRLRTERCFKIEDTEQWYALTYWHKGDIRSLWLPKADWEEKTKPESARTLREAAATMPKVSPVKANDNKAPEPAPVLKEPAPSLKQEEAPKIYYSTEAVRKETAPEARPGQVTAMAEAEFAKQEMMRKIERMKHANEIAAQRQAIDRGFDVGFEP